MSKSVGSSGLNHVIDLRATNSYRIHEVVNHFRQGVLGLDAISLSAGGAYLRTTQVPHTYFWSASIIRRARDWITRIGKYLA
jgi:hypothetical protein